MNLFYSLLIFCITVIIIRKRIKSGLFFHTVTGYHIIVCIFIALSSLFYYFIDNDINERIGQSEVLKQFSFILPPFVFGYFIVFILDYYKWVGNSNKRYFNYFDFNDLDKFNFYFLLLIIFSKLILTRVNGTSGIFTIFVVFSRLIFPCIILVFYTLKYKNLLSIINLCTIIFFIIIDLFFSQWRSDLIFVIISISISLIFKFHLTKKQIYRFCLLSFLLVVFYLPFQFAKKNDENFDYKTIKVINTSFDVQILNGLKLIPEFVVNRLNYIREMAYVNSAISNNKIQYQNGDSYSNLIYQLIPRELWTNKPLFNEFYGRQIPRSIGLVGEMDNYTSWAVNPFAEFLYNFNHNWLWLFVIILFFLFRGIDLFIDALYIDSRLKLYLEFSLFFLSLNLVSLIFSSTYLLWLVIIFIIFNKFIKDKIIFKQNYSSIQN